MCNTRAGGVRLQNLYVAAIQTCMKPEQLKSQTLTADEVLKAAEDEDKRKKGMTKRERAKRKHELSDPSTISTRLTSILAERFPPDMICDHIEEMLTATVEDRFGNVRTDMRAKEAGLKFALHFTVGTPAQRHEIVTVNVNTSIEDLQEQVDMSPALKARLAKMAGATLPDVVEVETEER